MDIFVCYEGPGQGIDVVDALDPCGFCGKTNSGMEIPGCAYDAGNLIDVLDSLRRGWAGEVGVEQGEVGTHYGGGSDNVR